MEMEMTEEANTEESPENVEIPKLPDSLETPEEENTEEIPENIETSEEENIEEPPENIGTPELSSSQDRWWNDPDIPWHDRTVSTIADLDNAISGANSALNGTTGFRRIFVNGNLNITTGTSSVVPAGRTVLITSAPNVNNTRFAVSKNNTTTSVDRHIAVNGTLILENIELNRTVALANTEASMGGGIAVQPGGELYMDDGALLRNNSTFQNGAGVHVQPNSEFYMYGGEITGNRAWRNGGGVFVDRINSKFIMYGGVIHGNIARGGMSSANNGTAAVMGRGNGGGVAIGFNAATVAQIANPDNHATFIMYDGEIYNNISSVGTTTLSTATGTTAAALNNQANMISNGGGVYLTSPAARFEMYGGSIYDNRSSGSLLNASGGSLAGTSPLSGANAIAANGGGVFVGNGATFIMDDGEIYGNSASHPSTNANTANGGGVFVTRLGAQQGASPALGTLARFEMRGGLISDNRSFNTTPAATNINTGGGGVYIGTGGVFEMIDTGKDKIIEKNNATNGNGGVVVNGALTGVATANLGATFSMHGGEIRDNNHSVPNVRGGGVLVNRGSLNMSGGKISNHTSEMGGGVYVHGSSNFMMDGGEISNNTAVANGGGIHLASSDSTFDMIGGKIVDNRANNGGGIWGMGSASNGMALINISGNDTIVGSKEQPNIALTNGGGIFLNDFVILSLSNDAAIGYNEAGENGGGLFLNDNSMFNMNGGKVIYNSVVGEDGNGGGVYMRSATTTLDDDALVSNNISPGSGGGLYSTTGTLMMNNGAKIEENKSGTNGGGVSFGGNSTGMFYMNGGKISANESIAGGGVYTNSPMIMGRDAIINGNTAEDTGGGVITYSTLTVNGGEISDNLANNGGGVYVTTSGNINTENASITNNTAVMDGGGIFTDIVFSPDPQMDYSNLMMDEDTKFSDNKSVQDYHPHANAVAWYSNIKFSSASIHNHPLNNDDINSKTHHIVYEANDKTGRKHEGDYLYPQEAHTILSWEQTGMTENAGYLFLEWNTQPDGSGQSYTTEDLKLLTSDITVYAQWENENVGSITINKYGENNQRLNGARFLLERKDYSGWVPIRWDSTDGEWIDADADYAGEETAGSGVLKFESLPENEYRITETYAPTVGGVTYSLLKEPIKTFIPYEITLGSDEIPEADYSDAVENDDGTITYYYYDLTYNVTDIAVLELPESGYNMPWIYTIVGLAIICLAAGVHLYYRKQNKSNKIKKEILS